MKRRCSARQLGCSLHGVSTKRQRSTSASLERMKMPKRRSINLVTIGIARKDIQTIRQYSERLIQLRPNSQTALEGLATCAFADEDFEAACPLLRKARRGHAEPF